MTEWQSSDLFDVAESGDRRDASSSGDLVLDRIEHVLIEEQSDEMKGTKACCTAQRQIS